MTTGTWNARLGTTWWSAWGSKYDWNLFKIQVSQSVRSFFNTVAELVALADEIVQEVGEFRIQVEDKPRYERYLRLKLRSSR